MCMYVPGRRTDARTGMQGRGGDGIGVKCGVFGRRANVAVGRRGAGLGAGWGLSWSMAKAPAASAAKNMKPKSPSKAGSKAKPAAGKVKTGSGAKVGKKPAGVKARTGAAPAKKVAGKSALKSGTKLSATPVRKSGATSKAKAPAAGKKAAAVKPVSKAGSKTPESTMVKIVLPDGKGTTETPWVTPMGKNLYRMENSPFFAYGVSYCDIVEASPTKDEARPVFRKVVTAGGHSTIRVAAADDQPVGKKVIQPLLDLGCTYEGANPAYLCVDVPPGVEIAKVVEQLMKWDETVIHWEHANPTWDDLYGDVAVVAHAGE